MQSGSLTAAAKKLNVSQSALSQVLRHMEGQLGFDLFRRKSGRLIATAEAHLLFAEAQKAADALDDVRALAANLGRFRKDHLKIACTPMFAMRVAPQALGHLRRRFPSVVYTLKALNRREIFRELATRAIDVGFMCNPSEQAGVFSQEIATSRFVAVCRRDLGINDQRPMALAEAVRRSTIAIPGYAPPGSLLLEHGHGELFERTDLIFVQDSFLAISIIALEGGLALVDELVARSFTSPEITIVETLPEVPIPLAALQVAGAEHSQVSDHFIQLMSKGCAEISLRL